MKKIELEKQLESYYEDCKFRKRLNEKTIKAYTIDLNQYLEFITTTEINQKIINEYIHYLNKKYLKYKTIKRKIASVKAFYSYLEYEEIIDYSPFNKIKTKIKEPKLLPKTIQKDYIDKIIHLLLKDLKNSKTEFQKKISLRNITLISVMFSTGIRVSELVGLNVDDVDFRNNGLHLIRKGRKEMTVYFGNEVADALEQYMEGSRKLIIPKEGHEDALFYSMQRRRIGVQAVQNLVKKYAKEVTPLKKITPHKLRSTYGTALYQETDDIYLVAEVLGHSDVNTTRKHYAAMSDTRRRQAAGKVVLRESASHDVDGQKH